MFISHLNMSFEHSDLDLVHHSSSQLLIYLDSTRSRMLFFPFDHCSFRAGARTQSQNHNRQLQAPKSAMVSRPLPEGEIKPQ